MSPFPMLCIQRLKDSKDKKRREKDKERENKEDKDEIDIFTTLAQKQFLFSTCLLSASEGRTQRKKKVRSESEKTAPRLDRASYYGSH